MAESRLLLDAERIALLAHLRHITDDERVLAAIDRVPRDRFLPTDERPLAWENRALPIGGGQTISQPEIVAVMLAALQLQGDEKVLDVGTGSGYQAALLAELAAEVISVERLRHLAERARATLDALGYQRVRIELAGQTLGYPPAAPYDAIVVAAAAPRIPAALVDQLAPGGRLVLPVGSRQAQDLTRITRRPNGALHREALGRCSFVPLIGPDAWGEDDGQEPWSH